MQKLKAIVVFLLILGMSYGFWQKSFAEIGVESLKVEGVDKNNCINFNYVIEPKTLAAGLYNVLSLHIAYSPKTKGKAYVEVYLNGNLIDKRKVNEIGEWHRIVLPKEMLLENNVIKICTFTSKSINKIEIKRDSFVARAEMADFSKAEAFEKQVSKVLYINEPAEVTLVIRNFGSREAIAEIKLRKWPFMHAEIIEEPKDLTIVVPKAENNEPGKAVLSYKIMPKRIGKMSLPRAVLRYKNVFGDIVSVDSTQPFIEVVAAERLIGSLMPKKTTAELGENIAIKAKVKNIGEKEAKIIYIELEAENADIEPNNFYITKLSKNQYKELEFLLIPKNYGVASVSCSAKLVDQNKVFSCGHTEILVKKPIFDWKILLGALAIIIIGLGYFYIIYR